MLRLSKKLSNFSMMFYRETSQPGPFRAVSGWAGGGGILKNLGLSQNNSSGALLKRNFPESQREGWGGGGRRFFPENKTFQIFFPNTSLR